MRHRVSFDKTDLRTIPTVSGYVTARALIQNSRKRLVAKLNLCATRPAGGLGLILRDDRSHQREARVNSDNTCHSSGSLSVAIVGIRLSHGERFLRRVPFWLGSSFAYHGPSCRRALFSSRSDACLASSLETQVGKRLSSTTCFPEAVCTSRICARCASGNRSESLTSAGHRRRCT
jgi:hypothetical protein